MSNRTVGEIIGSPLQREPVQGPNISNPEIFLGVELEIEQYSNNRYRGDYWEGVDDGTLRDDGRELHFSKPLRGLEAENAIEELYSSPTEKWSLGVRCSGHVHFDARGLTLPQLKYTLLMMTSYDDDFFCITDSDYRKKSPFAVQCSNNAEYLKALMNIVGCTSIVSIFDHIDSGRKYRSINLGSLRTHGSIELRHSRCFRSKKELYKFINLGLSCYGGNGIADFKKTDSPNRNMLLLLIDKGR